MTNAFTLKEFYTPKWLSNPHLQSILPKFIAPKMPDYRRELVKDSLNESEVAYDFYDVEDSKNEHGKYRKPLIVLFHGLEGGSDSHYARSLAHVVHKQDCHFVVPHYRSCGGVSVSGNVFYNAGDTTEAHHVLNKLGVDYTTIFVIGVSLGGNVLAKYMGEYGDNTVCEAAVVVSAPVDLASSAIAMQKFVGKRVYTPYLLKPLLQKALENNLPKEEFEAVMQSKTVSDFDHVFTAPRHGYRSANDYYNQASALPFLSKITKPTLIVTAKDDPFLGLTATQQDVSPAVTLLDTQHGGHIGFIQYRSKASPKQKLDLTWLPNTALDFFKRHSK
ncbi:alpha/beta fold hydrolase [Psychrobacter sp. HD31]|uniref:YheT family hydrolase n=1 Tax=Psychrobacter sp. HD31 TaxID=3112003 RepID=UPI003DA45F18